MPGIEMPAPSSHRPGIYSTPHIHRHTHTHARYCTLLTLNDFSHLISVTWSVELADASLQEDRQTCRQVDRQTYRQTDQQTDRQGNRETDRYLLINRWIVYPFQLLVYPGRQHDAGHYSAQQQDGGVDDPAHCRVPAVGAAPARQTRGTAAQTWHLAGAERAGQYYWQLACICSHGGISPTFQPSLTIRSD